MRVDNVVIDTLKSVQQILLALDNRLAANENFAPDGTSGQVLTSNGTNAPPSFQSIESEVLRILREQGLIT